MSTDITPRPPSPELWQVLDEATRDCAPTVFPRDRIERRAQLIRRRRRLLTGTLALALLAPLAGKLALQPGPADSHAVTSAQPPTTRPSVSHRPAQDRSPVRVVRTGERIEAGLGVWYTLKEREYCDANPGEAVPTCVGPLDVEQPGAEPMTANVHPFPEGVVYVLAYTGRTPAARITMTEDGRTTELPIVQLAGRPAYVSTYAVGAPRSPDDTDSMFGHSSFRVYDADGKELARMGGR
jgi:hypothetical protein